MWRCLSNLRVSSIICGLPQSMTRECSAVSATPAARSSSPFSISVSDPAAQGARMLLARDGGDELQLVRKLR